MTDLERAAQLLVHDLAWRKLELLGRLKHVASAFAAVRCEAEAAMREQAARECEALGDKPGHDCVANCAALIRALPLTPEEPAAADDIVIVRSEGMLSAYRRGEEPAETHHLTPSEQRIMDKALRKSLRPLTPEKPAAADDVVAELDDWLSRWRVFVTEYKVGDDWPTERSIQRARDEIVALREMREAHLRMLRANLNDVRNQTLEEAATACLRKARDHVIPIGQDNYHDGCVACAAAIRALKEKGHE